MNSSKRSLLRRLLAHLEKFIRSLTSGGDYQISVPPEMHYSKTTKTSWLNIWCLVLMTHTCSCRSRS